MLIKTAQHNDLDQFFIGFPDDDDSQRDQAVAKIYCKVWTINTGQQMLNTMYSKTIRRKKEHPLPEDFDDDDD